MQTEGVEPEYIRNDVLPDFFKYYWVRKMAIDRRNCRVRGGWVMRPWQG